nr:MAG TPA: hypothetical protein [Caudoviricetes sp.]
MNKDNLHFLYVSMHGDYYKIVVQTEDVDPVLSYFEKNNNIVRYGGTYSKKLREPASKVIPGGKIIRCSYVGKHIQKGVKPDRRHTVI